jgi:hypothetical protein
MTLDGQAATVQMGTQVQPRQGGSLVDVGIDYIITPKLLRNGAIHLDYSLSRSELVADGANDSVRQRRLSGQIEARQDQHLLVCATSEESTPSEGNKSRELLVLLRARNADLTKPSFAPRTLPTTLPATTAAVPPDLP